MRQVAGVFTAVIGAALGFVLWLILMKIFDTVCRGIGDFVLCAGMGGPSLWDMLTLPVAVIGGAVMGWRFAIDR